MRAYLDLVRVPGVANVTASQLFARLPLGMLSLAILLHVQQLSGSYAQAGAVVAAVSVGEAVAMPITARLAGRVGVVPTLSVAALVSGASMLALAFAGPPSVLLMTLGVLIGASVPPLMPVVRALYPKMVAREGVRALFALDTTAQELIWVVGPVAATFLASAISTAAPLILSAAVTVLGTAWFLLSARRLHPGVGGSKSSFGRVLANRTVILAMVTSLLLVASFMALEVGIVAELGRDGVTAGAAIAVASIGSLIGGLLLGHRRLGISGVVAALAAVAIGTAMFGIVENLALQFAALFFSGLGFAPAMSALYLFVSREVAEHSATEAFGWLNSGALVGGAVGTASAGVATEAHGSIGAVVVAALLAAVAACCPLVARAAGPIGGLTDPPTAPADTVSPASPPTR
ncbi:MFS transporter [Mycolicibacterium goodii]|uniref:MFS transporter n=1 Tax=Mycolicibacterium goodii TaxID=134601 RepID=A0ABS6HVK7_MYCGD|nr:MFS transporter [Mycolicibacterium goodii]MBU8826346.1 MFS transporter [Mycolicibacterium goodii]MBU8839719.1 MFS transporter [Mycolicibacterium goodii]OKH72960.1 MFS transporter [Mycobacterium sp. SWH-M5]